MKYFFAVNASLNIFKRPVNFHEFKDTTRAICALLTVYRIFFSDALVYGAKNKITTQFTLIFGADSADTLEALHSREKKNQKPAVDYTTTESYTTEPPYIAGCSALLYAIGRTWL